ncbi:MAG TPA: Rrf2 family transcriptional regulator [Polyangia bacterium]|jgi:Rrf2 family protein
MRLTSKTQYGVRALYDLAFHGRGQATQAKEIADRQGIPPRYLEQILQDLKRAGIVEAKRGPRGGYALTRGAGEIRLGEILRALRGALEDLFTLDGVPTLPERKAARAGADLPGDDDIPALVWHDVIARLVDVLDSVTLQDFVDRAEAAGVKRVLVSPQMYFI